MSRRGRRQTTVTESVRQTLRAAGRQEPRADGRKKLDVLREAAKQAFPTGHIDQVLAEIEQGYLGDAHPRGV